MPPEKDTTPADRKNEKSDRQTSASATRRVKATASHASSPEGMQQNVQENVLNSSLSAQDNAPMPETGRRMENWTPTAQTHELAIESSPMGARQGTGSRPQSRARGYSSTMSLAGRKGDMSSRVLGTPSSILSNFRRRPRQPSILQMMQADDSSSGLDDDDDFLGGLSSQDESTPLRRSRGKSLISKPVVSSPSDSPLSSLDGSKQGQDTETRPVSQPSPSTAKRTTKLSTDSNDNGNGRNRSAGMQYEISETSEEASQAVDPPISSPLPDPKSTALDDGKTTDDARVQSRTRRIAEPESNLPDSRLPTTTLQQKLLPRRHQRKRGALIDFDLPSDDIDSDPSLGAEDDELSYLPIRGSKKTKPNGRGESKPMMGRKKRRMDGKRVVNRKDPAPKSTSARQPPGPKEAATYTSHSEKNAGTDKENQEVGSSSPLSSPLNSDELNSDSDSLPEPVSKGGFTSEELRLQARKFAEIDRWQMEFEDVADSVSG